MSYDLIEASFSSILGRIWPSPLDDSSFHSPVNNTFRNYRLRDSVRNEVRNEASWLVIKRLCQYAKSAKVLVIVTAETTMGARDPVSVPVSPANNMLHESAHIV